MMNNFKELEIHTLICNRDVLLAINNFKSLQKFEEFNDKTLENCNFHGLITNKKELKKNRKVSKLKYFESIFNPYKYGVFYSHGRC